MTITPHIPSGFMLPEWSEQNLEDVRPEASVLVLITDGGIVNMAPVPESASDIRVTFSRISNHMGEISLDIIVSDGCFDYVFVSKQAGLKLRREDVVRILCYVVREPQRFIREFYRPAAGNPLAPPHIPDGFRLPVWSEDQIASLPHGSSVLLIRSGHPADDTSYSGKPTQLTMSYIEWSYEDATQKMVSMLCGDPYDYIFVSRAAGVMVSVEDTHNLVTYGLSEPTRFIIAYQPR